MPDRSPILEIVAEITEVEIIARDLRAKIAGRKILDVRTDWPRQLELTMTRRN